MLYTYFLESRFLQVNVNIGFTISNPRCKRSGITHGIVYVIRTARKAVLGLRYREFDDLCVTWALCLN